jgi:hypothetical protein
MHLSNKRLRIVGLIFISIIPFIASAQQQKKKERKREFYFSWGYNSEWYTHSNLHVSQPNLGDSYTMEGVQAHDHEGWNGQFFTKALTIPQYNYRIGYIFNKKKGLGFEINFDHTKYLIRDDQQVHIVGTVDGKPYNGNALFKENETPGADSNSYYYLNNGANFLLFNLTKRWHLLANKKGSFQLDGMAKLGAGPVIPHVQDKFFTQPANDQHFQVGGWNVGTEGAIRATFFKFVYLEYTNKFDFASYSGLRIYDGSAHQSFGTYEMILNLGITFPGGRHE